MEESGSNVGKMKGEETETRKDAVSDEERREPPPDASPLFSSSLAPPRGHGNYRRRGDADARWTDGLPGGAPSCRSSVGVGGDQARVARRENKSKRKTGKAEGAEGGGWRLH